MEGYATARLGAYATFAVIGLLAALLLGRPEPALLALPFAALAAAGAAFWSSPGVTVKPVLERDRVLQGDEVAMNLTLEASQALTVEVLPILPGAVKGTGDPVTLRLEPGSTAHMRLGLLPVQWGVHALGMVRLRARSPLSVYRFESRAGRLLHLRAFPRPERLGALPRPAATQIHAGDQVARAAGEGIEFAEVGAALPAERLTRVNWRVSARRGELHVNRRHPERNVDVVLFLDTFAGAGAPGSSTHDRAVELVAALAAAYLRRRDRVALVGFGGILRWLRSGGGARQRYRVLETLLESEVVAGYAWKGVEAIPAGVLPAGALVLAVSPLLDVRSVAALTDLRGRGFDVAILELDPVDYVEPRPDAAGALAYRLWRLQRAATRNGLQGAGIAVTRTAPKEAAEVAAARMVESARRRGWRSRAVGA